MNPLRGECRSARPAVTWRGIIGTGRGGLGVSKHFDLRPPAAPSPPQTARERGDAHRIFNAQLEGGREARRVSERDRILPFLRAAEERAGGEGALSGAVDASRSASCQLSGVSHQPAPPDARSRELAACTAAGGRALMPRIALSIDIHREAQALKDAQQMEARAGSGAGMAG
jgi:hypothetical protein